MPPRKPYRYRHFSRILRCGGHKLCWPAGALSWHDDKNAPARRRGQSRILPSKIFGSVNNAIGRILQDAGWNARSGGRNCRRRKIPAADRRSAAGDVSPISAISHQVRHLGRALEARSTATGGSHEEQDSGAWMQDCPSDIQTWNSRNWTQFCFLRGWRPWRSECWA